LNVEVVENHGWRMKMKEVIVVKWLDANFSSIKQETLDGLKEKDSGKDLLFVNTTYGKLGKVLKDIVIIIHEESNNCQDLDVTIIPRKWIISPEELK
jgi:hypothetical protein